MKMAEGGYRPAYNVQFAADTESQVIVGLDVATSGADQGLLTPMVRQLRRRYGRDPDALLADAGFLKVTESDERAPDTTLDRPVRTRFRRFFAPPFFRPAVFSQRKSAMSTEGHPTASRQVVIVG